MDTKVIVYLNGTSMWVGKVSDETEDTFTFSNMLALLPSMTHQGMSLGIGFPIPVTNPNKLNQSKVINKNDVIILSPEDIGDEIVDKYIEITTGIIPSKSKIITR